MQAHLRRVLRGLASSPAPYGGAQLQPAETAKTVRIKDGETARDRRAVRRDEGACSAATTSSRLTRSTRRSKLGAQIPSARMGGSVEVRPLVEM